MKIDVFPHILPKRYKEALYKMAPSGFYIQDVVETLPTLYDLDHRFRIMDKFEGLMQVLTLSNPPIEQIGDVTKAVDLTRLANDEMAELVARYLDRFVAATVALSMIDMTLR
jgi:predicted TIM-barrel fold metal-dependent hydrolase